MNLGAAKHSQHREWGHELLGLPSTLSIGSGGMNFGAAKHSQHREWGHELRGCQAFSVASRGEFLAQANCRPVSGANQACGRYAVQVWHTLLLLGPPEGGQLLGHHRVQGKPVSNHACMHACMPSCIPQQGTSQIGISYIGLSLSSAPVPWSCGVFDRGPIHTLLPAAPDN